jgi:hypothetical protein
LVDTEHVVDALDEAASLQGLQAANAAKLQTGANKQLNVLEETLVIPMY